MIYDSYTVRSFLPRTNRSNNEGMGRTHSYTVRSFLPRTNRSNNEGMGRTHSYTVRSFLPRINRNNNEGMDRTQRCPLSSKVQTISANLIHSSWRGGVWCYYRHEQCHLDRRLPPKRMRVNTTTNAKACITSNVVSNATLFPATFGPRTPNAAGYAGGGGRRQRLRGKTPGIWSDRMTYQLVVNYYELQHAMKQHALFVIRATIRLLNDVGAIYSSYAACLAV